MLIEHTAKAPYVSVGVGPQKVSDIGGSVHRMQKTVYGYVYVHAYVFKIGTSMTSMHVFMYTCFIHVYLVRLQGLQGLRACWAARGLRA